jgi:hypothetical protein
MAHHIRITGHRREPLDLARFSKLLRAQVRARQRRQALEQRDAAVQRGDRAA